LAAKNGHLEIVRLLIKNGADVNIVNKEKETALHLAAKNGHLEIVGLLIEKLLIEKGKVDTLNNNYITALHLAAKNGHLEIVKLLIENGADVNVIGLYVNTAIYSALERGHLEIVKLLIDNGANVNALNTKVGNPHPHETVLNLAVRQKNPEIVSLLLNSADVINKNTSLHLAAENGHLEIIRLLIDNGADVNSLNTSNKRAITLSNDWFKYSISKSKDDYLNIIQLLLENGSVVDDSMISSLEYNEIIKNLLEKNTNINFNLLKTDTGQTLLESAINHKNIEIVKLLLKKKEVDYTCCLGKLIILIPNSDKDFINIFYEINKKDKLKIEIKDIFKNFLEKTENKMMKKLYNSILNEYKKKFNDFITDLSKKK